nr:hypothetical protein CFP56_62056 [Quercus suber]
MHGPDRWLTHLLINTEPSDPCLGLGGLFLDHQTIPTSFVSLFDSGSRTIQNNAGVRLRRKRFRGGFLSASLSIKGGSDVEVLGQNGNNRSLEEEEEEDHETTSLSLCNKEEDEVKV